MKPALFRGTRAVYDELPSDVVTRFKKEGECIWMEYVKGRVCTDPDMPEELWEKEWGRPLIEGECESCPAKVPYKGEYAE